MKINPGALSLQAQLQAQLQKTESGPAKSGSAVDTSGASKVIVDRPDAESGKGVVVKRDNQSRGVRLVSTEDELQEARDRAEQFSNSVSREAPNGRLSEQLAETRNKPLGLVVDILV